MIILMLRMIILMGQDDGSWLKAHGTWPRGAGPTPEPRGAAPRNSEPTRMMILILPIILRIRKSS